MFIQHLMRKIRNRKMMVTTLNQEWDVSLICEIDYLILESTNNFVINSKENVGWEKRNIEAYALI